MSRSGNCKARGCRSHEEVLDVLTSRRAEAAGLAGWRERHRPLPEDGRPHQIATLCRLLGPDTQSTRLPGLGLIARCLWLRRFRSRRRRCGINGAGWSGAAEDFRVIDVPGEHLFEDVEAHERGEELLPAMGIEVAQTQVDGGKFDVNRTRSPVQQVR